MFFYIFRRAAAAVLLAFLVLSFTFALIHLAPGEPAALFENPKISAAARHDLRRVFGLDRSLVEQYVAWLDSVVRRWDWGVSLSHGEPAADVIARHIPATLLLAAASLLITYPCGIALGVAAARRSGSVSDHIIRIGSLVAYSLPLFWVGLMAILALSYGWAIFPSGGMRAADGVSDSGLALLLDRLRHLALPALVLGFGAAGGVARLTRTALLEQMALPFIRTARAKGVTEGRLLWIHALRNALVPLVQVAATSLPFVLSGALIVEVVFSWPGLGRVTFSALRAHDYPLILAATAWTGILVIVAGLAADLAQALIDPRTRDA